MEILTLLRLNGKRLAALLVIGAITGAVAAAVVAQRPANFEATTTVFVSQALPGDGTSFDVGPLVSDFQQAVTLPEVRRAVAEKLRLPADEVLVIVNRNGVDGGSVEVTAAAPNARDAEAISQTVATEGMRFLARREVNKAANIEQLRGDEVKAAEQKRTSLLTANNAVDPIISYQTTQDNYLQLRLDINDPRLILTDAQKVQIDAQAAALRQQLPALERAAEEYQKVQQELENAKGQLETARLSNTAANEVLAAATTDVAISAGETVETSKVASIMQAFAAAVVAVLVVGVAFFALADSSRRRPARALPGEEIGATTAAGEASRGRALADSVMPAAYRPSALEAIEQALESEERPRVEPASAARPATLAAPAVPAGSRSANTASGTSTSTVKTGSVTGTGNSGTMARSTTTPASSDAAAGTTAGNGSAARADSATVADTGVADAVSRASAGATNGASTKPAPGVSPAAEVTDRAPASSDASPAESPVSASDADERKPAPAAERPRRARRPEAQSMFTRPAETATVAPTAPVAAPVNSNSATKATAEEAVAEEAPVNADARQRRSAANRRRLGS